MTLSAVVSLVKKSTTGRSLMAAGMRGLCALSPRLATGLAARLFLRPDRRRARAPAPRGVQGHRFEVVTPAGAVAAWDFGEGPTVLLAHGWSGSAADLDALIAPLVALGFYVVAWDAPGHGQSPGASSSIPAMGQALLAVGARVGPVHAVIAHSLGAAATTFALSRGLQASRVALLAPAAQLDRFPSSFARALGLAGREREVAAAIERRVGLPMAAIEPVALAPAFRAPVLIVHDPSDREVPYSQAEALAAAWPSAALLPAPGLGHLRLLRDAEVVRATVLHVAGPGGAAERSREAAGGNPRESRGDRAPLEATTWTVGQGGETSRPSRPGTRP